MTSRGRTKILLITRNLPPLVGGMEILNWHMADQLCRRADVRVIGPVGSTPPNAAHLFPARLKPLPLFLLQALFLAIKQALHWKPDIVIAGSGLTAPVAHIAAHMSGSRSITYLHGLDIGIRNPIYRAMWVPAIRKNDLILANSRATAKLASRALVSREKIRILNPGVHLAFADSQQNNASPHSNTAPNPGNPLLLSVGRLTERKGLLEFVRDVLPIVVRQNPTTQLLVVGDEPHHALFARPQARQDILLEARKQGVDDNIKFVGVIRDRAKLSEVYRQASMHVFPVRTIPGDPEGFGMVAVEAAAHGLATVAYATGGTTDAVSDGVSGWLVPSGDAAMFAERIGQLIRNPLPKPPMIKFASNFSWECFGSRLWQLIHA